MTSKHTTSTLTRVSLPKKPIRWIGGVLHPHGCKHHGKPMRVAAWIDGAGSILSAAIVEGHGPTVLRDLLDELLVEVDDERRPATLTVWPSVRSAFSGLEYPPVTIARDDFLLVVIEDEADCGGIPGRLQVRTGSARARKLRPGAARPAT
jgi:hypothetical protein